MKGVLMSAHKPAKAESKGKNMGSGLKKSKRHDTDKKNIKQNETFADITFNIIGAGKLGQQLAFTLTKEAGFSLLGIYDNKQAQTKSLVAAFPNIIVSKSIAKLPNANLTFITTPDDAISNVVDKLVKTSNPGIAVHFSGALSSEVLLPLKQTGWSIASIHPLRAFAKDNIIENVFTDCYCALEGDPLPCEFLKATFIHLGAKVVAITSDKKMLYHASASLGSNSLVGLLHTASDLLTACGFSNSDAKAMIESLALNTLTNIQHASTIGSALTGPIARGDINTVTEHLNQLSNPVIKSLYQISGKNLLSMVKLPKDKLALFEELFKIFP